MKKIQTLNEELNRMKGLMDFKLGQNSHDTLSDRLINEQVIGIGTDTEKEGESTIKSTQTTYNYKDFFNGTIKDIYRDLGECKGILKQVRNLAVTVAGTPLSDITGKKTFSDFLTLMKKTQSALNNEIKQGDEAKNSELVQSILDYSKNKLDKNCVKKFQENLLKYTESKNEIETPEGKKEYADGIVGLLTLKGYVDAEIAYYENVFSKWDGIKDMLFGKFEISKKKGDSVKGFETVEKSRGDIEDIDQETKTKQSLKDN